MQPSSKRQKPAATRPDTPLSLYKQAVRLVRQQQCGDVSADQTIHDKLQRAQDMLLNGQQFQQNGDTVSHNLDLELADEPLFLLASIYLQLGRLYQRQDNLTAAEEQYRASLKYFPNFVAALSSLGQVQRLAASTTANLEEAQQLLQQAIDTAQQLCQQEGGLLVDSNKACAAELEAADEARAALAMLLCQRGCGAEAAPHLCALGFKYRLAQEVLSYHIPQPATPAATHGSPSAQDDQACSSTCSFMQALDDALPPAVLQHLQQVFRPGADFWQQHAYGRVGYFSYYFQLDQAGDGSSMHQLAQHLQQLGAQYFPDLKEARYAEFWAHCRRHSSGHQLHFDSDDEGQGGVRHPIITAILYLSDNTHAPQGGQAALCGGSDGVRSAADSDVCEACRSTLSGGCSCQGSQSWVGGPTLMTDQVLGGPLATHGWLAYPATNRVVFFDGRYLHGVIPGRGAEPTPGGRRSTLMMAFWRDLKCRTPPGKAVGACMALPDPASAADGSGRTWHHELTLLDGSLGGCKATPVKQLRHVSAVWQSVDGTSGTSGAAYHSCFQGF